MFEADTLSVLVAERRRERETTAAGHRLAVHTLGKRVSARGRAAETLRRLADRIDTQRVASPQPGLEAGRGCQPRPVR